MLAATLTIRLNGLKNIVAFQIRIIIQEFFDSEPSANLANNHADRHSLASNARLASHHGGVLGDARERIHDRKPFSES